MCVVTGGGKLGRGSDQGAGNLPLSEDFHQCSFEEQLPPQDRMDTPVEGGGWRGKGGEREVLRERGRGGSQTCFSPCPCALQRRGREDGGRGRGGADLEVPVD